MLRKLVRIFLWVLFTFPLIWLVLFSFQNNWEYPGILNITTLKHWKVFFKSEKLINSISLSFLVSLSSSFIATTSGYFLSKSVSYSWNKQKAIFFAYLPLLISPIVFSIIIYFYFIFFGLTGSVIGVITGQLIVLTPYSCLFFFGFWNSKTRRMEQLARSLGANPFQLFVKVLLPISKEALIVCFFQVFLFSWFDFAIANYIGVGKVSTLTVVLYTLIIESNYFLAALASMVLIFPPLAVLTVQSVFRKSLKLKQL